jgi:hypothetical protein
MSIHGFQELKADELLTAKTCHLVQPEPLSNMVA